MSSARPVELCWGDPGGDPGPGGDPVPGGGPGGDPGPGTDPDPSPAPDDICARAELIASSTISSMFTPTASDGTLLTKSPTEIKY